MPFYQIGSRLQIYFPFADGGDQDWVPKDFDKIKADVYVANLSEYHRLA